MVMSFEVVMSAVDRARHNLGLIKVLHERRKHYFWRLGELQSVIRQVEGASLRQLYEVVVHFGVLLEKLKDGEEWFDKTNAFVQSQEHLKELEESDKKLEAIISAHMPKSRFRPKSTAVFDQRRFDADNENDFNETKKVVAEQSFDERMTQEARKALQNAKEVFSKYKDDMPGLVKAFAARGTDAQKLVQQVTTLAKRGKVDAPNPALEKRGSLLKRLSKRLSRTEKKRVFMLDLSTDYKAAADGGFLFNPSTDGGFEMSLCYVFLPGSATHILKTWSKGRSDTGHSFRVTLDEKEIWAMRDVRTSTGCFSFDLEGHKYEHSYQELPHMTNWTTKVDGVNDSSLAILTHQQFAEASAVDQLNKAAAAIDEIMNFKS